MQASVSARKLQETFRVLQLNVADALLSAHGSLRGARGISSTSSSSSATAVWGTKSSNAPSMQPVSRGPQCRSYASDVPLPVLGKDTQPLESALYVVVSTCGTGDADVCQSYACSL